MSNACYTIPGSSNEAYCTSQSAQQVAADSRGATFGAPYVGRIREYHAFLPNAGLVWQMTPTTSLYASYNRGFSAPTTDIYAYDDKVISLKCGSAWKRDPVSGVIGVEKGPLILVF
jgi:iron complex outermembrane receptor protein